MPPATAPLPRGPNKVPVVAAGFWIIKILSTTVGETCADYLAVDAGWGTTTTQLAMAALLAIALAVQLRLRRHVPLAYWVVVVLISIVGTQLTDLLTDGLKVSLYASTTLFAFALAAIFVLWHQLERSLSIRAIDSPRRECFYWLAILCTFALGTAAGDLATEELGLGFTWGVVVFGALIAATAVAWRLGLPSVPAFWTAYILTRPLGAALGDLLSQSREYGGLGWGAMGTSIVFLAAIVLLVGYSQWQSSTSAGRAPAA